jgi:hypothetical protein
MYKLPETFERLQKTFPEKPSKLPVVIRSRNIQFPKTFCWDTEA